MTDRSSESPSLVSTEREETVEEESIGQARASSPRLRNSFALDFFIVMKRFRVRLGPLSFETLEVSPRPVVLLDDGIGEPMRLVPVLVDG